jgi:hypothetical protein
MPEPENKRGKPVAKGRVGNVTRDDFAGYDKYSPDNASTPNTPAPGSHRSRHVPVFREPYSGSGPGAGDAFAPANTASDEPVFNETTLNSGGNVMDKILELVRMLGGQ